MLNSTFWNGDAAGARNTLLSLRPGVVELGWGHPDLDLLPVEGIQKATEVALERDGPFALAYGAMQGPPRLIEPLRARLERTEGVTPDADAVMVTGGVSQALDLVCTRLTDPGDSILVEGPTYHLALPIFRDHHLDALPVSCDEEGIDIASLDRVVTKLRDESRTVRFVYLTSTFSNPTAATLSLDRREALISYAEQAGLTILEDDVYSDLWYEEPPPPSLYNLAPTGPVIRLSSFSKTLAPGLRLGWMAASPDVIENLAESGVIGSGGGVNHFTAHIVAAFIELGMMDRHVSLLRSSYRTRRDALIEALAAHLPESCEWTTPKGGYFLWLHLPSAIDSADMLPMAEAYGVSYVPGADFFTDGSHRAYCRLAFTLATPGELQEGARRLGAVIRDYQAARVQ